MSGCKYYDNMMELQINPTPKIVRHGEFDMNTVVYNTQGQLVGETQRQRHIREFAEQCKRDEVVDRGRFVCPQKCDNRLWN
jgi:hypothetical protein